MARNAIKSNFWLSKMAAVGILWNNLKKKESAYWSEMTRNVIKKIYLAIQNGLRRSFCAKKMQKSGILIWNGEKYDRKWFRSSKMAAGDHFVNKIQKKNVAYWSEMERNAIKSYFRSTKMPFNRHSGDLQLSHTMQVRTKLLPFVRGAYCNWLDYCPSEVCW